MTTGVVDDSGVAPDAPELTEGELAMVEKGRAGIGEAPVVGTPAAPAVAERPDHIPEKFWKDGAVDTDALAKSYTELEKTRPAPAAAQETPAVTDDKGQIVKPVEAEAPAAAFIEAAGAEFSTDGKFSDETIANLEKIGIPKEIQEGYLMGMQAMQRENLAAIHGYVGGEQAYQQMAAWAGSSLNDADLDAFNNALDNPQLRETAVKGLFARYSTARPSEGTFVAAVGAAPGSGDVFGTRDELVAAQKDPRYTTDTKYREEVTSKLLRSQQGGFRVNPSRMFDGGGYSNGR